MISLHSSHFAHSPCIREGCWRRLSTSSGFTGVMRGFLLNQEAIERERVYGRRLPASTKAVTGRPLELEGLPELEHLHRQPLHLALQLGHERRLQVVEQHVRPVPLELPQLAPEST